VAGTLPHWDGMLCVSATVESTVRRGSGPDQPDGNLPGGGEALKNISELQPLNHKN